MNLENKEQAYIPVAKLLDYLLSETHPVGKSKAKYFRSLGFNETNIGSLKQGLDNTFWGHLTYFLNCRVDRFLPML